MEAEVRHLDLDEELVPSPGGLKGEVQGELSALLGQSFEVWAEGGWHRNRERPVLAALGGRKGDFVFGKIDTAHWDPRLAQAAAGVKANLESSLHPLGFHHQSCAEGYDVVIGHFWLFGRPVLFELQADERICLRVAKPDRFANDHGERLQLEDGCVPTHGFPGLLFVCRSPIEVLERVAVGDVPRRMELPDLQPEGEPPPGILVALQRPRGIAVAGEKLGDPRVPTYPSW